MVPWYLALTQLTTRVYTLQSDPRDLRPLSDEETSGEKDASSEDFVYFYSGYTGLGDLLKTRSSVVWLAPLAHSLPHGEFTQHLLSESFTYGESRQLCWRQGERNSVCGFTWAGRRRRTHQARRPCCRRCTTPAAFSI